MKKLIMTAAVVACASIVSAQVVSDNIVGYAKFTASDANFEMVSLNFAPSSGLVQDLIGDQLPFQSKIYVWNGVAYDIYAKSGRTPPGSWGTATLAKDDAFWVEVPAGQGSFDVALVGEVDLSPANTRTIATASPFEMVGMGYPVEVAFGDTDLAAQLPFQSKLYVWNGASYDIYARGGRTPPGAWTAEANAVLLGPTVSFWVETGDGSPLIWSETRPFNP